MLEDDHSKECGNFIAKNSQNIERCTQLGYNFTFYPMGKQKKLYPSSAGNIWVSGYVHHRLKRGHPGHKYKCSVNEIIPENPPIKSQKSANTVIPTMSRVLQASTTQRGKPSLVDINNFSYTTHGSTASTQYWRCAQRKCGASRTTRKSTGNLIGENLPSHNHGNKLMRKVACIIELLCRNVIWQVVTWRNVTQASCYMAKCYMAKCYMARCY